MKLFVIADVISGNLYAHLLSLKEKVVFYVVIGLLLSGCKNSTKEEKSSDSLKINFTEKCIPIDYNQNSLYIQAITKLTDSATLFYAYNKNHHKIDVFNLSNASFLKEIQLEYVGPAGIPYFNSFDVRNNEDLIFGEFKFFSKLSNNALSKVFFSNDYNQNITLKNGFDFDNYLLDPGGKDKLPIDSFKNYYLGVFPITKMRYYEIIKFNFEKRTLEKLDYEFPSIFNDKFYGDNMTPNIIFIDNSLLINYGFSSKVFRYDLQKKTTDQYDLNSSFTKNLSNPISKQDFKDPALRTAYDKEITFFGMKYDPFRNLYYRIHLAPRKSLKEKPRFYLMIIDMELNVLKEIELPSGLKPYFEIGNEGVYFPKQTGSESQLCFELLEVY